MTWEVLRELISQQLSLWTVLAGGLILILTLFITLASKDLRWSIYIFILAVVFTSSRYEVIHMVCYVLRWLILAMITLRVLTGRARARASTLSTLFFLWTLLAILSALQAPSMSRGLVFGGIYLLCFIVFFLLIPGEITTEEHIQNWIKMFTFMAWTFAIMSFVVFILNPRGYVNNAGRLMGIFANPMKLCRILVFAGTIFIWRGLIETGHGGKQITYYIAAFFCALLVFMTGSRGGLGGLAIAVVVFSLHYRRKMLALIIPMLVIAAIVVVPWYLKRASEQFVSHISTLEIPERIILRELGFERFKEKPILGWGLASLSEPGSEVCPGYLSFHNSYLNFLVEFGLPGFIVVMIVLVWSYYRIWRLALFHAQNDYIKDVAWYFTANLSTLFIWNFYDGALSYPAQKHFYWALLFMVLTDCLIRINEQTEFEPGIEYLAESYPEYSEGLPAHT